jgi:hypothetical protein
MGDVVKDSSEKAPEASAVKTHEAPTDLRGTHHSSWFPSGEPEKSKQDSATLANKGTIPELSIEQSESTNTAHSFRGWIADSLASPEDKKVFQDYNKLAAELGSAPLTDTQKLQIENLPPDQKEMYRGTLNDLINLKNGKISPADYMMNTLSRAAGLAEANGRSPDSWNYLKPSQGELFKNYIGLTMSEKPLGIARDTGRELVGGGPNIAGSALETMYQSIIGKNHSAGEGFNTNITDTTDPNNSITHHFREFLLVGYNRGKYVADKAAAYIDSPAENPGDVRDGYFAGMLGAALSSGDISPRQAADLTKWAYTKHGGTQPPWGAENIAGKFLDPDKHYNIKDWLKAYHERQD